MKKLFPVISFFVLAITFQSCLKNDLPSEFNTIPDISLVDNQFQSENFGNPTTGNFLGTIRTQNGEAIKGVQITIGNSITTTDRNGIFVANDVSVFENFAYIKAKKSGYLDGSRVVIPKTDGVNKIEIVLLEKRPIATINSGEASEVNLIWGGKVRFTGDFITANGDPYTGSVDVVAEYLPPNSGGTFAQMPGALFAQTESNSARTLETYGIMTVNLFSPSGQELNIDSEHPATLEFPISFSQSGIAPETINLWYFDEEVGYWKEEGEATKQGDKYIAEVSHFTWWNCDLPLDYINLCFTISPTATNPIGNVPYDVYIQRALNDQLIFGGPVTSGEVECGFIPRNEELNIYVYGLSGSCNTQLVHQETIGGFANDATTTISFTEQSSTTNIQGTVTNCNGTPLTEGYVYIDPNNIYSITDGIIDIGIQHCNTETISVQIYNQDASQWVIVPDLQLNGGVLDIGSLSTCEDTGGIFNGNIVLNTQEQVNDFGQFNFRTINGNLTIGRWYGSTVTSDIVDLSALSSLESVENTIFVQDANLLENLDGLEGLRSAGFIRLSENDNLTSIEAITHITDLNSLHIINNESFQNLDELLNLSMEIENFVLEDNGPITSLSSLQNITITNSLKIDGQHELSSLEGINATPQIQFVEVLNNDGITDLTGLENFTSITYLYIAGNDALESLAGLENLIETEGLHIGIFLDFDIYANAGNNSLRDYCALQNLFANGSFNTTTSAFTGVTIEHNLFNPTYTDIGNGNCSF